MRQYVVDTNIWIEFLRADSTSIVSENLLRTGVMSYVTLGELLQGARNNQEQRHIISLGESMQLDLGSPAISQLSIWLVSMYGISHGVGVIDAIIAATALERGLVVITKNRKHFACIDGLRVQSTI